ncbi:MAG: hypothetical protein QOE38_2065, partial [Thermoleophilaceae bacterium]|nr:hypothetical protein [Thermoleophilaceae bacterium]
MAMSLAPRNTSTTSYSFEFTDLRAVASGIGVDFRRGSPSQQDQGFGNRLNAAGGVWIGDEPSLWHVAD